MSFREFSILRGMGNRYKKYRYNWDKYIKDGHKKGKAWRGMEIFEQQYPLIAKKYFDIIGKTK